MSRDISARVVVVPRRDMDAREVYKGTRPPPPKRRSSEEATPSARAREGKRARGTDRGTTDDDEGARARGRRVRSPERGRGRGLFDEDVDEGGRASE